MTIHSLGPWYLKLLYHANGHEHVMTLPFVEYEEVLIGEPPLLMCNDGTAQDADVAVEELVTILGAYFKTTDEFYSWEMYKKPTPSSPPVWVTAGEINDGEGTSSVANVVASQLAITFRTKDGNHFRLQLMEGIIAPNLVFTPAEWGGGAAGADIVAYLTGDAGWVRGRDNAKLIAGIRGTTKINDVLRRRYII